MTARPREGHTVSARQQVLLPRGQGVPWSLSADRGGNSGIHEALYSFLSYSKFDPSGNSFSKILGGLISWGT